MKFISGKLLSSILTISVISLAVIAGASAKQKYDYCSICRAVVQEADDMIKDVDPKKTIQSGSYRIGPDGNHMAKEIQYARSDTHVEEVVEAVCKKLHQYADRIFEDGSRQLIRLKGRSDDYNDDLKFDEHKGQELRFQCDHFIEDYEEDIISYLQDATVEDYEKYICVDKTDVCTSDQLSTKIETFARPKQRHNVEVEDEEEEDEEDDDDDKEEDDDDDDKDEDGDVTDEDEQDDEFEKDEL